MTRQLSRKGKKQSTQKRGGYDKNFNSVTKKTSYAYFEGGPSTDREEILKDGKIGDIVHYISNNQSGYIMFTIVAGREVDGKTLREVGDIYGSMSDSISDGETSRRKQYKSPGKPRKKKGQTKKRTNISPDKQPKSTKAKKSKSTKTKKL